MYIYIYDIHLNNNFPFQDYDNLAFPTCPSISSTDLGKCDGREIPHGTSAEVCRPGPREVWLGL